ncbi:iron-sulfur cluster repair di-iron protein [Flavihumibacter sp. UBA7668]|uniref:iron-sulfur cluster repair di-iron protein n=1 Tax=Flavihumibacter sp. UBA7668 TaxID=1946542 RepID=UPI0025C5E684|nr:iron-sulfur cluster repair di-iron protein [Flavihumibacter sp. UBA7668]
METIRSASPWAGMSLGEIATADLRKAQVLKKFGLDFCCGGKKSLLTACAEKGIDSDQLLQELEAAQQSAATGVPNFKDWTPALLVDYIIQMHHAYVLKTLPDLLYYAGKVAKVHGQEHPELLDIQQLVMMINEEMRDHMQKEEGVLFPYIKNPVQQPFFGTVNNPIAMMEQEHEQVGDALARIRVLTNNYSIPEGACGSYQFYFRLLEEFENDLHIHVHLENNILFPKAKALEKMQQF